MATRGDIAATPFYCTSSQDAYGYNERNLAYDTQRDTAAQRGDAGSHTVLSVIVLCLCVLCSAKAGHWEREYQWHAPSAEQIRQRFLVKPGRDEQRRSQPMNADVAEVLQARTGLLGSTCDLSTANSLRVTARHGEAPRGRVEGEYPVPFSATQTLSPHDSWAARTIPAERTAAKPAPPAAASQQQVYNSRQTAGWDSEYLSQFCPASQATTQPTKQPNFMAQSLRDFSEQQQSPEPTGRPLSPTQPLVERVSNERVSAVSLESMQRPVHRKTFYDLSDEYPANVRPSNEPYSFDLTTHIERMRPTPLFKDVRAGGVPQSEHLRNATLSISQIAAQSLANSTTSTR